MYYLYCFNDFLRRSCQLKLRHSTAAPPAETSLLVDGVYIILLLLLLLSKLYNSYAGGDPEGEDDVYDDKDRSECAEYDDVCGLSQLQSQVSSNPRNDRVPDTHQHQHRHRHHYVYVLQKI